MNDSQRRTRRELGRSLGRAVLAAALAVGAAVLARRGGGTCSRSGACVGCDVWTSCHRPERQTGRSRR